MKRFLACILLIALFVGVYLLRTLSMREAFFDSDLLYLPALFNDLANGVDIRGWRLPPAPYFFPDMVLFFPIRAVSGSLPAAIALQGLAQVLVLGIGLSLLYARVLRVSIGRGSVLFTAAGGLYFLLMGILAPSISYLLLASTHTGILLTLPYLLVLGLSLLEGGDEGAGETAGPARSARGLLANKARLSLLLVLLSGILVASDQLALVQALLPLALTGFGLALLGAVRWWDSLYLTALLGLAWLLGKGLYQIVVPFSPAAAYMQISRAGLETGISGLKEWLTAMLKSQPVMLACVLGFGLACLGKAIRAASGAPISLALFMNQKESGKMPGCQGVRRPGELFFPLFYLLMAVVTLVAVTLTGTFSDRFGERYLTPLLAFGLFFGWPLLPWAARRLATLSGRWLAAGLAVLALLNIPGPALLGRLPDLAGYYPESIRCLDEAAQEHGLRYGIANYWDAKYASQLSRVPLQVVQVDVFLIPYHWINNASWYREPPQFVIVNLNPAARGPRLNPEEVIARFGAPAATIACADWQVLVYNRAQDEAFRGLFAKNPILKQLAPGESARFSAAYLPGSVGAIDGEGRAASGDAAGYLNYGPYLFLPPGTYQFSITYEGENAGSEAGRWTLAVDWGDGAAEIASGSLPSGQKSFEETFKLTRAGTVEVQTYFSGGGKLKINEIKIQRIE